MNKNLLSVIVCVYNEERTIEKLINKVEDSKLPDNFSKEIIIIDNCSTDKTKIILKKFINKKNITIKLQNKNYGKGNSIIEGLKISKGEFIVFQDADLEYDPENYYPLIKKILNENLDAVFGSRLLKNKDYHIYKLNSIGSRYLTNLINYLFNANFTDSSTNHKLIKTKVLKKLDLRSRGFELDFEIALKLAKNNYKYTEIPISFKPRTKKDGKKIKLIDGFKCMLVILRNYFNI